ncbi:MAG: DUF3597 domain-containing protein [Gemmatimonadota bacterium]|nr:DUF3597 domain-containing protein [Gemmatimonadota bacterium]
MSILGSIFSKIFHHDAAPAAPAPTSTGPSATTFDDVTSGSSSTAASAAPTPMSEVDVEGVLTNMASKYSHPVNWRESIVDLMSMLGIDNSLAQRRALAHELGYTGDTNDTATMNIWLHKQVMQKLAANGGKVPADLL